MQSQINKHIFRLRRDILASSMVGAFFFFLPLAVSCIAEHVSEA